MVLKQQILHYSQLTKNIHCPCYCTVHLYVVIHYCDSMWSFLVEANLYIFFYRIAVEDQIIKREGLWSH